MLRGEDREALLRIAGKSVAEGLYTGHPLKMEIARCSPALARPGACFVTLKIAGRLRGCIGSLEAWRPLAEDCAENAFAAAFRDPRFPLVTEPEYPRLNYHISVLSPVTEMTFTSENDLLAQLHSGVDGLVLEDRGYRGTFLPSVWDELADPKDFLDHLKQKAGLPRDYWSDTVRIFRYTVENIYQAA